MKNFAHVIPYDLIVQVAQVNEVPAGVALIQAPQIWHETKGKGITVAVLDTGCDREHPDLQKRIIGGRNFTDDDGSDPTKFLDYNGHGTHVAGTIAAQQDNNGVVGVAPEASLLIVKVLNKSGTGQYEWIIKGIHYAIEQKVDIISMSLGGPVDVPELHEAIKKAVATISLSFVRPAMRGMATIRRMNSLIPAIITKSFLWGQLITNGTLPSFPTRTTKSMSWHQAKKSSQRI